MRRAVGTLTIMGLISALIPTPFGGGGMELRADSSVSAPVSSPAKSFTSSYVWIWLGHASYQSRIRKSLPSCLEVVGGRDRWMVARARTTDLAKSDFAPKLRSIPGVEAFGVSTRLVSELSRARGPALAPPPGFWSWLRPEASSAQGAKQQPWVGPWIWVDQPGSRDAVSRSPHQDWIQWKTWAKKISDSAGAEGEESGSSEQAQASPAPLAALLWLSSPQARPGVIYESPPESAIALLRVQDACAEQPTPGGVTRIGLPWDLAKSGIPESVWKGYGVDLSASGCELAFGSATQWEVEGVHALGLSLALKRVGIPSPMSSSESRPAVLSESMWTGGALSAAEWLVRDGTPRPDPSAELAEWLKSAPRAPGDRGVAGEREPGSSPGLRR